MNRIALLVHTTPIIDDTNFPRMARSLTTMGLSVDVLTVDSLSLHNSSVVAEGFHWDHDYEIGQNVPTSTLMAIDHGLVWVLSLGNRFGFLDKYQLLRLLEPANRIINCLDAIMHLNSKYLPAADPVFQSPETYASPRSDQLVRIVRENPGYWIVKPPAGSLGRDVFKVDHKDSNLEAIIANLCGPNDTQYTLLQRYVSEIENGEKRVLIAGGRVIDQYLRTSDTDHRTNVTLGASTSPCDLDDEERQFCGKLAATLLERGVMFAGLDLAYPWLIEVNVINPGGLGTIAQLTGRDRSDDVCGAILAILDLEF